MYELDFLELLAHGFWREVWRGPGGFSDFRLKGSQFPFYVHRLLPSDNIGPLSTHSESENPSWFIRAYNLQPCSSWFPHGLQSSDSDLVFLFFPADVFWALPPLSSWKIFKPQSLVRPPVLTLCSVSAKLCTYLWGKAFLLFRVWIFSRDFWGLPLARPFYSPLFAPSIISVSCLGFLQPLTLFNLELVSFLKFVSLNSAFKKWRLWHPVPSLHGK